MDQDVCETCLKPQALCVCSIVEPIETKTKVLILQHPQEPDKQLGSVPILKLALPNSVLKVGLSWRNLAHALGTEADPKEWMVLYLGSSKAKPTGSGPLILVDKNGEVPEGMDTSLKNIKGIVVLDGTWSQAKTLWWRNAWLLKLRRAVLAPERPSLYGRLRKEPRRESVSTLESTALALGVLEKNSEIFPKLTAPFKELLVRAQAAGFSKPKKKDYRRRYTGRKRG
ncbi:MAG: DTW domain-containing protein [Deltaproteobacteria bacterium]|nr:DTW domain-containing protein [Deltaproteobacteria bacterium]